VAREVTGTVRGSAGGNSAAASSTAGGSDLVAAAGILEGIDSAVEGLEQPVTLDLVDVDRDDRGGFDDRPETADALQAAGDAYRKADKVGMDGDTVGGLVQADPDPPDIGTGEDAEPYGAAPGRAVASEPDNRAGDMDLDRGFVTQVEVSSGLESRQVARREFDGLRPGREARRGAGGR
jgi:hypothetical protein